ncbi:pyridoxamine 5'-phosphate oxidase family protein [Pseudalkalibacillus salsuginis]|uniref:pyridoxamine 5'-phosphate oxidase family protein n=1 Tax=Pseudalkalibacillus salsuginis TaxID=2910972 RepID=UPI001F3D3CBF|nr:pyridoxamine 5'-phosphate oxidase family protein [Pseudalkalibacillus salsuginis]MCF6409391.1 pyridoxamine 5'-phosphate oxidase family protein [Pseudalkalibacillus salsuginis]
MGKQYSEIHREHMDFIRKQHLFFVSTAPLSADGHVNVSPKGYDTLRILSPTEVAYLDLTGSGNETTGHIEENERITFMFCAFEGPPQILRLYGNGKVILPDSEEWGTYIKHFDPLPGIRQIITANIHRVSTSCGYSVPFMEYVGERETLNISNTKKASKLENYRREKNAKTIDGLDTTIGKNLRS